MEIVPIADFHCPLKSKFGIPRQSGIVENLEGSIVFRKEFSSPDALRGLEDFDYLWIIWGFSENKKNQWQATVRPPRLGGNKSLGVFATRSPYRPNPLGLSSVKILSIEANVIKVQGADLMDGTPIYDIKPYVSYADSHKDAKSGFVDSNDWNELNVIFPDELKDKVRGLCGDKAIDIISSLLAQDPRPKYHNDPNKSYGMKYDSIDIHFSVTDKDLIVKDVTKLI